MKVGMAGVVAGDPDSTSNFALDLLGGAVSGLATVGETLARGVVGVAKPAAVKGLEGAGRVNQWLRAKQEQSPMIDALMQGGRGGWDYKALQDRVSGFEVPGFAKSVSESFRNLSKNAESSFTYFAPQTAFRAGRDEGTAWYPRSAGAGRSTISERQNQLFTDIKGILNDSASSLKDIVNNTEQTGSVYSK